MKAYYTDQFVLPLPPGHRFPMLKYSMLRERVAAAHLPGLELLIPHAATDEQLGLVHQPEYLARVIHGTLTEKEIRRIGFPWSPGMVERSRRSVGGTIAACRSALEEGLAANLAGGTHHAYPDHGEGYCVFNDVAVAARVMQLERRAHNILLVDLDVHQGNGSAAIFAGDDRVFTFSVHGSKNFPFHKEYSDLDIALPDQTGDDQYLEAVQRGLNEALLRANADLAIYLAGADPFVGDTLGRMAVSKAALAERDRIVLHLCRLAGLPVAITMSGGYAKNISDIVDIHFQTIQLASTLALEYEGGLYDNI
jgi:acetoin utilization deacetylase AcuC-like enzyme